MIHLLEDLAQDWRQLDDRIDALTRGIAILAREDAGCRRLMGIPGVGVIIASAIVAAVGTGVAFAKGRDFAAWLGLVPKQISTGNRYLRALFVGGAQALLQRPRHWRREEKRTGTALAAASKQPEFDCIAMCGLRPCPTSALASRGECYTTRTVTIQSLRPARSEPALTDGVLAIEFPPRFARRMGQDG
jgi:hypothetical protein